MKKQQKSVLMVAIITAFIAMGLFLPGLIRTGDLEPSVVSAQEPPDPCEGEGYWEDEWWVVEGTEDPTEDVGNVQCAIDNHDKVLLRGNFDFGDTGSVSITNSVEIVGENTTIENGEVPFSVPIFTPGIDIKISNLTLVNPTHSGIGLLDCGSLTVDKVNINGVKTGAGLFNPVRWGIRVDGFDAPITPRNISITDCNIDLVGDDSPYTDSDNNTQARGILVGYNVGTPENETNVLIKGNTIRNTMNGTILVMDIAGTATIEDNTCKPGNIATGYFGGQIITVGQNGPYGWGYPSEWAKYTVMNNTLEAVPKTYPDGAIFAGFSWGILPFGTIGSTITRNDITSSASDIWFILFDYTAEAYVGQNTFSGTGIFDLGITIDYYSVDNVFVGNNLTGLNAVTYPNVVTYFLGETTANNTVRGYTGGSDAVIDLGTNNFMTGVTPMSDSQGIGQHVSQTMQDLHEYLSQDTSGEPSQR